MSTKLLVITVGLLALHGCRNPGLPPEPPELDAANPEAGVVASEPAPDPFTRSAFEGEALDDGGHAHHHHGHGEAEAAEAEPTSDEGEAPTHDAHAGHRGGGRS